MLNNFFKTAFRSLSRNKLHTLINLSGLTLGLTACILIGLFVRDENQYDQFVPGEGQIFRVCNAFTNTEGKAKLAVGPPMFATVLQNEFPEVEQTVRVLYRGEFKTLFEAGKSRIYEEKGLYTDPGFPALFSLRFIYGKPANSLEDPHDMLISDEIAKSFFGNENPVGREILKDKEPFRITGVFVNNPKFHLQFNYIQPLAAALIPATRLQSWEWQQFLTYARLKEGTDVNALEKKFQLSVSKKSDPFTRENHSANNPFFQPLSLIHLHSADLRFDMAQQGNILYTRALSISAVFILLIAIFNFVNLATAKSFQRAKEVGVRKSIGASRKQLMFQFVGETTLLSLISMAIAVALTGLLLPWLNHFTGKHIPPDWFAAYSILAVLAAVALTVGFAAGFYPALILSRFKPARVLKNQVMDEAGANSISWLRHGLVIVQFSLSVLLIISAMIVYRQVDYLHHRNLGFQKENILFFPMRGEYMMKNYEGFKNELLKSPGISNITVGYGFPGDAVAGDEIIVSKSGVKEKQAVTQLMADYDYLSTLGLQLVAGRDFSKSMQTDKDHAFIINETAVRSLGFETPGKALGRQMAWNIWDAGKPDSLKTGWVIGVVRDFHYKSLYDKIEPAVIQLFPGAYWKMAIKMKTAESSHTLAYIRQVWDRYAPEYPMDYKYLDDNFQSMYLIEDKLKNLLGIFTGLSVFIACLGLFGLIAFAAEKRRKEIGIRKVLGASVQRLVWILTSDFLRLVLISLLVASPIAGFFMQHWLEQFAYRIQIGWSVYLIASLTAIGIVLLTISFQAIRAALSNPVRSLKSD